MNNYSLSLCDFGLSQFYPQSINCYILIPIIVWIKIKSYSSFQINKFCIKLSITIFSFLFYFIGDRNFTLT